MNKKYKSAIKFSKVSENSLVQIQNLDDLSVGKTLTLQQFMNENVWPGHVYEGVKKRQFDLKNWYKSHQALLTVIDGEIKIVLP